MCVIPTVSGAGLRKVARESVLDPAGRQVSTLLMPVKRSRRPSPGLRDSDEEVPDEGEQQDDGERTGEQPADDEQPDVATPAGLEREDLGHLDV